jgi:hypothetical protein
MTVQRQPTTGRVARVAIVKELYQVQVKWTDSHLPTNNKPTGELNDTI